MKVATKRPQEFKSPVRITDTRYELWFSRPQLMGTINRVGTYWFTGDGMKFISSRAALDYLVKMADAKGGVLPVAAPVTRNQQPQTQKSTLPVMRVRRNVGVASIPNPANPKTSIQQMSYKEEEYSPSHPQFQEFLRFMKWKHNNTTGSNSRSASEEKQ